jgi:serine/threonine-protein kinase
MVSRLLIVEHDNPQMADTVIAGRYRLIEPLARGSMSSVWLAEDEELGRRVAVKTLSPTADRARFEREARAVAALSHPNIGGLYDYGEADGKPYMVLEYLPNGTLADRLRDGRPLPDEETQGIAIDIASGLAYAHERGLVHRDIKPANILFDAEQRAKLADFGIVRTGDAGTLTEAGTVLGTASYISPEQASGEPAGAASDVYSFGVLLFRMLTGRLPFVADNAMEQVRQHRDDPPPLVADVRPDAPSRLARIADTALRKDPASRLADGGALLAALRGGGDTEATRIIPPLPRAKRRLPPALTALLVLLLLGAGIALALVASRTSDGSPPPAAPSPSLSLPKVPTVMPATAPATSSTRPPTTTAATTAATPTTRPVVTAPATTRRVTTAPPPATTAPATTSAPPPATTAPPPAPTTDTTPATTAPTTT